jgi:sigma-E factor negative regulatory protein RseA
MVDSVKEQVSACLDGELPERELPLLSKRLGHDAELKATLTRYALISETLRTGEAVHPSKDFAEAVMARIASEPASQPAAGRFSPRMLQRLRPAAGIAVAATVAALAVFSVQQSGLIAPSSEVVADNSMPSAPAAVSEETDRYVVPSMPSTSSAFVPATRLTNYVVAHSEYSSPLGRRSVLSGVLAEGEAEVMGDLPEEVPVSTSVEDAQR